MANYKDLALVKGPDEEKYLAILPTSTAYAGDIAIIDGEMYDILQTTWINTEDTTYAILCNAYTLLVPEKVLHVKWEKDETNNVDA